MKNVHLPILPEASSSVRKYGTPGGDSLTKWTRLDTCRGEYKYTSRGHPCGPESQFGREWFHGPDARVELVSSTRAAAQADDQYNPYVLLLAKIRKWEPGNYTSAETTRESRDEFPSHNVNASVSGPQSEGFDAASIKASKLKEERSFPICTDRRAMNHWREHRRCALSGKLKLPILEITTATIIKNEAEKAKKRLEGKQGCKPKCRPAL